jgi:hypothetical protein
MAYAKGPRAIGLCDRCGFQYLRKDLKFEALDDGRRTKLLHCPECLDVPNPQADPKNFIFGTEAVAIQDPRPDTGITSIRALVGADPAVGVEIRTYPRFNP